MLVMSSFVESVKRKDHHSKHRIKLECCVKIQDLHQDPEPELKIADRGTTAPFLVILPYFIPVLRKLLGGGGGELFIFLLD